MGAIVEARLRLRTAVPRQGLRKKGLGEWEQRLGICGPRPGARRFGNLRLAAIEDESRPLETRTDLRFKKYWPMWTTGGSRFPCAPCTTAVAFVLKRNDKRDERIATEAG